jgi:hypothetical protein
MSVMATDDSKSGELVWVTGYGGEQIQIPREELEESCRLSGKEYPADTSSVIWLYGESGARVLDALFEMSAKVEARSAVEHKTRIAEAKNRKSKPQMRQIFDGRVLVPEGITDAEIDDAFERFAESRGWHARIRCGPYQPPEPRIAN